MCLTEDKGICRTENVTYEIVCGKGDCDHVYIGESDRNAFCRGRKHLLGLKKRIQH